MKKLNVIDLQDNLKDIYSSLHVLNQNILSHVGDYLFIVDFVCVDLIQENIILEIEKIYRSDEY